MRRASLAINFHHWRTEYYLLAQASQLKHKTRIMILEVRI
jgi:hypothetical protein